MAEYIEREAVLKEVEPDSRPQLARRICEIPVADVVPVRHGRWIRDKVAFYLGCSECGCYLEYAVDTFLDNGDHYHFCPNCGALMDKDGDGE